MSDKIYLGQRLTDLDIGEEASPISRVTVVVDSENAYTAGDDTGRMIEVQCPWGTQAMAESILSTMSAVSYKPYSGSDSLLDPAAELGDGITAGGVYSVLAAADTSLDAMCLSGISAPATDEIDDEYPYKSKTQRSIERKLSATRSLITKTAEEIRLEVENELEGLSSSITVSLDSIKTQVSSLSGQVSTIEQYVDSLTLSVSNGSTSSTITLKSGNVTIASQNITMSGLVTLTSLYNGTTTIDGGCIKAGSTIEAPVIVGADIYSGAYWDINELGKLELAWESTFPMLEYSSYLGGSEEQIFAVYSMQPGDGGLLNFGGGPLLSGTGSPYFDGIGTYGSVYAEGKWLFRGVVDFSNAKVTGLPTSSSES